MLRVFALLALVLAAAPLRASDFPTDPLAVRPPLLGSALPAATLRDLKGAAVELGSLLDGKPAVLVFYRGGWCPYCTLQLSQLRTVIEPLRALGYPLIAISPDSPASLTATLDKQPLPYTLLSDSDLQLIGALGIGFRVDAASIEQYQNHGIDLEAAAGKDHHVLPVPAVFVVDAAGIIQFHYVNPDYRVRVPGSLILEAARSTGELRPLR
jgi:peroxiredoxin